MEGSCHYSLPYNNLQSFLENYFGNPDPLTEARRFTNDVQSIIKTMRLLPSLTGKSYKNQFNLPFTQVRNQLKDEGLEIDSIVSVRSGEQVDGSDVSQDFY